jgi:hypothetical protein
MRHRRQKWFEKGEVLTKIEKNSKKRGKTKKLSSSIEMGLGSEWKGELWDSASRKPGVRCGCSCSTTHYAEAQ